MPKADPEKEKKQRKEFLKQASEMLEEMKRSAMKEMQGRVKEETEGVKDEDELFERNWKKAKEVGIIRGAYHFFLPQKSGRAQAENFMNSVELESGDLPPVLDVEETYGVRTPDIRKRVKEWLYTIEAYYHVKPIIYTNVDYYKNFLGKDFDEYPLWVAHYLQSERPRIEREWTFWQHNEAGKVNGILPGVDFNVFNGDSTAFKLLLKQ